MADDLADDFLLSDDDYAGASHGNIVSMTSQDVQFDAKRKRKGGDSCEKLAVDDESKRARKKLKLKQRDKARKEKRAAENLALEPGSISRMPRDTQADHLRKLMRGMSSYSKLSELELDEIGIQESMLIDVSLVDMDRSLAQIVEFLKGAVPQVYKTIQTSSLRTAEAGLPYVLFISGNAQRAADIARSIRPLIPHGGKIKESGKENGEGGEEKSRVVPKAAVAKLFARHFKITEQQEFLHKHICPLAVGTPQRLTDLLGSGALQLRQLECIVLDVSWVDQKKRTILDGPETRQALFSFLCSDEIQNRLRKPVEGKKAQVLLF